MDESLFQKVLKLHFPVQLWLILHLGVAKKSWQITEECRAKAVQMQSDPDLDGDYSGGQVDAFRHVYWMARLTQEIGSKKALRLGAAHEKGNEIDFRKKKLEEQFLPTFIACEMDYRNNETGAALGEKYPNVPSEELVEIVKQTIIEGRAVIIKKNSRGEFLDSADRVIPEKEYKGLWHTSKTLVSSDYVRH
jgi:hypothetical protein